MIPKKSINGLQVNKIYMSQSDLFLFFFFLQIYEYEIFNFIVSFHVYKHNIGVELVIAYGWFRLCPNRSPLRVSQLKKFKRTKSTLNMIIFVKSLKS